MLAPLFGSAADKKVPAKVDAALRARVEKFYEALIAQKYSEAVSIVAPESQDLFIGERKGDFNSCETGEITYSDKFMKATVVEKCKGELRYLTLRMPETFSIESTWKQVHGKWYWYEAPDAPVATPFGPLKRTQENMGGGNGEPSRPALPADPAALARNIMQLVKLDKTEAKLKAGEASEDAVEVTNGMPGPITVSVEPVTQPGLTVKLDKTQLQAGEKAKVMIRYDPAGKPKFDGSVSTQVHVQPTGQSFPITIIFEQ